ncbi:MAG: DMT family transporter [Proteobacteria bacterium]|nr:DMT family transporter [Pseudomonadota bacterium]
MAVMSDNIRGALLMTGGMCAFTVNDAFMKSLSGDISLFQAVLLRGIVAIICLTIMCRVMDQLHFNLPRRDWGLILLRTLGEVGGTYFFLTALFHMPIANVSAILQALPLAVSLAATLFLGEALGWRRFAAIAIGFVGVVLIIQPGGADFSSYSIYALIAVACITLRDLAVRRMSVQVPVGFVALIAAIGVTALGAIGSLFITWQPMSATSAMQIGGATICLMFGYIFSVSAMRSGEISFVAPFRYTSLLVALILGMAVFNEWPNVLTVLGASIVVATGLFTLWRERRLRIRHNLSPERIR